MKSKVVDKKSVGIASLLKNKVGDIAKDVGESLASNVSDVAKTISQSKTIIKKKNANNDSDLIRVGFSIDEDKAKKFKEYYIPYLRTRLKLLSSEMSIPGVLMIILKNMEMDYIKKYGTLVKPTQSDIEFLKKQGRKGIKPPFGIVVNDTNGKLGGLFTTQDMDLLFKMAHTFMINQEGYELAGRFSLSLYMYIIMDYLEHNKGKITRIE